MRAFRSSWATLSSCTLKRVSFCEEDTSTKSDWSIWMVSNLASSKPVLTCLLTSRFNFWRSAWSFSWDTNASLWASSAFLLSAYTFLVTSALREANSSLKSSGVMKFEAYEANLFWNWSVKLYSRFVSLDSIYYVSFSRNEYNSCLYSYCIFISLSFNLSKSSILRFFISILGNSAYFESLSALAI